jgi:ABC-type dipeptide/oligopeptide/nickel transport system permease subunit
MKLARSREVLRLKEFEFTEAAKALGASSPRVIGRHLLPNAAGPLIVAAAILVGRVIVMESVLSFRARGSTARPGASETSLRGPGLLATEPWLAVFPGYSSSGSAGGELGGDGLSFRRRREIPSA